MEADQIAAKQVLEPAKLVRPADILTHIEEHEVTHGLYGWWFDDTLPEVPRGGCCEFDGKHLLYIGIAPPKDRPAKSGSATPVRKRLWRIRRLMNALGFPESRRDAAVNAIVDFYAKEYRTQHGLAEPQSEGRLDD